MSKPLVPVGGLREAVGMVNGDAGGDGTVTAPRVANVCTCGATLNPDGSCQGLFAAAQADRDALTEKLARWLYAEYGGPYDWDRADENIRENYRRTARDLLIQLPGVVLG